MRACSRLEKQLGVHISVSRNVRHTDESACTYLCGEEAKKREYRLLQEARNLQYKSYRTAVLKDWTQSKHSEQITANDCIIFSRMTFK